MGFPVWCNFVGFEIGRDGKGLGFAEEKWRGDEKVRGGSE